MGQFGSIEGVEFISAKEAFKKGIFKPAPQAKIDAEVSKIVGKPILVTDPRLIKLAAKWKTNDGDSNTDESAVRSPAMDNHLQDPKKIADLKRELG